MLGSLFITSLILLGPNEASDPISNFTKPTNLPKYFAIDIDDTFYVKDQRIMQKNTNAFKLLKNKNITPFFCTGRNLPSAKTALGDEFFTETQYNGYPGVYVNGAVVYDCDGSAIHTSKFSEDFLKKFFPYMGDANIKDKTLFITEDSLYMLESLDQKILSYMNQNNYVQVNVVTLDELKTKDILSIYIISDVFKDCPFKDEVYNIIYPKYNLYQLTPSAINKQTGLEALLKKLNSNANECAFIGDSNNDIEAMEYCPLSFAVGNATPEAKNKAKWVVDLDHDKGAFEKVVNLLLN